MKTTNYKLGDYISTKDGKLTIKSSKKKLIKMAEEEIKQWEGFIKKLKEEI